MSQTNAGCRGEADNKSVCTGHDSELESGHSTDIRWGAVLLSLPCGGKLVLWSFPIITGARAGGGIHSTNSCIDQDLS